MFDRRLLTLYGLGVAAGFLGVASAHVGKVLISAQFTRRFLIGFCIVVEVFIVVTMVQASLAATTANDLSKGEQ